VSADDNNASGIPKCRCPDPGPESAAHCALMQDFPGGFYGDMEANDYYGDDSLWCDCLCHEYRDDWDPVEDDSR
jgi:hypothetical protein